MGGIQDYIAQFEKMTPEQAAEGAKVTLTLSPNALVRLRLVPVAGSSDPGYDYSWYCKA